MRQAFLDIPGNWRHDKLTEVAKKGGINLAELAPGDFVLFMNGDWSRMFLMGHGNVLVDLKAPKRHKISILFLKALPKLFRSGASLDWATAMKPLLETYLVERGKQKRPKVVEGPSGPQEEVSGK